MKQAQIKGNNEQIALKAVAAYRKEVHFQEDCDVLWIISELVIGKREIK